MAGEGEGAGLEVHFEGFVGDIGGGNREKDVVLLGVRGGGALGPKDYRMFMIVSTTI